jgi:hypothetical protein
MDMLCWYRSYAHRRSGCILKKDRISRSKRNISYVNSDVCLYRSRPLRRGLDLFTLYISIRESEFPKNQFPWGYYSPHFFSIIYIKY